MPAFQPETWIVVFHTKVERLWVHALSFGKYKHVSAFRYVPGARAWVFYDVQYAGTALVVVPDCDAAIAAIDEIYRDCLKLRVVAKPPGGFGPCIGFYCVPAIKRLIGHRCGALTPSGLLRSLIRQGAEVIDGSACRESASAS